MLPAMRYTTLIVTDQSWWRWGRWQKQGWPGTRSSDLNPAQHRVQHGHGQAGEGQDRGKLLNSLTILVTWRNIIMLSLSLYRLLRWWQALWRGTRPPHQPSSAWTWCSSWPAPPCRSGTKISPGAALVGNYPATRQEDINLKIWSVISMTRLH